MSCLLSIGLPIPHGAVLRTKARRVPENVEEAGDPSNEIVQFDMPPYVTPQMACNDEELDGLRRGVRYRGIYDREALERPNALDVLETMVGAGEEARVLTGAPIKLAIADRRVGLIPLDLRQGREEGILLHPSPLLDALYSLFETCWARAVPIKAWKVVPDASRDESEPSESDRKLVALLAAGVTDQVIAQQLGISQRTVERRIKRLMDLLDVRTRFHAGARAASRGWI